MIDGDTLEIHGTRIRLWGIDAPESTQLPGRRQPAVSLRCEGRERSRRLHRQTAGLMHSDLAGSIRADRRDVQSASTTATQRNAEHAGRGVWTGSYVEPWLYRACVRQGGRPTDCWTMLVLIPEVMSG